MTATFLPVLLSPRDANYHERNVVDEYSDELFVSYTFGPPYGDRWLTRADLDRHGLSRREVRRRSAANLDALIGDAQIHGQPPALMLSFEGFESSMLLADEFWDGLQRAVPGDLVVGAPARDVVIITGSGSRLGMEKARRCVDRVFFAGGSHLLCRRLLVRRRGRWARV